MGGSTRIGTGPGSLIGRGDDLEYVTAFTDQAAISGGALLLSGEAGVGKTVLLDGAAAHAAAAHAAAAGRSTWPRASAKASRRNHSCCPTPP